MSRLPASLIIVLGLALPCAAQDVGLINRGGTGVLLEDTDVTGYHLGFDVRPFPDLPFGYATFAERFSRDEMTHAYYGITFLYLPALDAPFYAGVGLATAAWEFDGASRSSPAPHVLVGTQLRLIGPVGVYAQGRYIYNTKTSSDTRRFNDAAAEGIILRLPFLFDADLSVTAGFTFIIR